MSVKIAIIGAGSGVFSINLIKDICVNKHFDGASVTMMDINEARLDGIYGLCRRYIEELGENIHIEKTMDREEALRGADFVIHVALDYGHARLREGWKIAKQHGYQFGGSLHVMHDEAFWVNFHQLRLMESVYQDIRRICPNAWMLLVANPVQAGVTYLTRKYPGAKIVGMCHGSGGVYEIMEALGYRREDCHFEVSGVNHFIWLTEFYHNGENAYPALDRWLKSGGWKAWLDEKKHPVSPQIGPKSVDLYERLGRFPIGDTATPGGGAWGWWYHTNPAAYEEDPDTWYDGYFKGCEDTVKSIRTAVDDKNTPVSKVFSAMPSDEPMIPTIEALAFDVEHLLIVNIPNEGEFVPGVPRDYEVECRALVSGRGIQGIRMKPLSREILAQLCRDRIAPVEMELRAFETGDVRLLEQLVLMDPWTRSLEQAQSLIGDILNMPCNRDMKEYYTK
jgi:alpha-galactosidase